MIYNIGQFVKLKEKNVFLEIVDSEIILNNEIYYTNDGSCYPLNYIEKLITTQEYLENTINEIGPKIMDTVKKELKEIKEKGINIDFWINERKKKEEERKLIELQIIENKKEKRKKILNKIKNFFLL